MGLVSWQTRRKRFNKHYGRFVLRWQVGGGGTMYDRVVGEVVGGMLRAQLTECPHNLLRLLS